MLSVTAIAVALSTLMAIAAARTPTRWPRPRLGVHVVLVAVAVLPIAAVAIFGPGARVPMPQRLRWCVVKSFSGSPLHPVAEVAIRTVAAGLIVILLTAVATAVIRDSLFGRRLRRGVALAGQRDDDIVWVVDDPTPAVYCSAGHPAVIVTTTAARAALSTVELAAVLAHERAHLAGHHALLRTVLRTIGTVWPWLPAARLARQDVASLVEFRADDVATRTHDPLVLLHALVRLAEAQHPRVLAAGGVEIERARRLAARANPSPTPHRSPPTRGWTPPVAMAFAVAALITFAGCSG